MKKVHSANGYDFYMRSASGNRRTLYNIVPENSPAPKGGYHSREYIERIKHASFPPGIGANYPENRKR